MSTSMTTAVGPLAGFRRIPRPADLFADVTHVDECGAPVLAADARDLGITENEMPASTTVRVYGTGGYLTTVSLAMAQRDADRGDLTRIGARAFELTDTAKRRRGPGLTPAQARRAHLAAERAKADR